MKIKLHIIFNISFILLSFYPISLQADQWWLSTELFYGKPFLSPGYSGSQAEGMGTQSRLEYRFMPWMAGGLSYGQMKIAQKSEKADLGFGDASVRIFYPHPWGVEPFALLGLGAGSTGDTSSVKMRREASMAEEFVLGVMLSSPDRPWAMEGGVGYHRSGGDADGFQMMEGHASLQWRFSPSPPPKLKPSASALYQGGLREMNRRAYTPAANDFTQALWANRNDAWSWQGLGNAKYMQSLQDRRLAIQYWETALKLNPRNKALAEFVRRLKGL
jgi:hypothetical protein